MVKHGLVRWKEEKQERLRNYHTPFHDLIVKTIDDTNPKVLLSLHSFTPKLNKEDKMREWHCGVLYDSSVSLAKNCIDFLSQKKTLIVGDNQPYKIEKGGDYTIPYHGDNKKIPAILIEIRQDLIQKKIGQEKWAGIINSMIRDCFKDYL